MKIDGQHDGALKYMHTTMDAIFEKYPQWRVLRKKKLFKTLRMHNVDYDADAV